jgi:alpha-D-xyloside xylohydrolase
LQVCSDSIIHILYSASADFHQHPNYVVVKTTWDTPQWSMQETKDEILISTARLMVSVSRIDAAITYSDIGGDKLVQDANRWLTPMKVNGEDTYRAESFVNIYGSHEGFYGLGQHQAGVWNYRGESVDISQDNTNISILSWSPAKATRFTGTTNPEAGSTTASRITSTSAPKLPTPSTTTSFTVPISTR